MEGDQQQEDEDEDKNKVEEEEDCESEAGKSRDVAVAVAALLAKKQRKNASFGNAVVVWPFLDVDDAKGNKRISGLILFFFCLSAATTNKTEEKSLRLLETS